MPGSSRKREYTRDGKVIRTRWRARYIDPEQPASANAKIEKTFQKKAEAEAWLTRQAAAVQEGSHVDPRKGETPLREVAEAWKATWNARPLSPKTQQSYASILTHRVLPRFGGMKVASINAKAVQDWVNTLAGAHHAETVHHAYTVLRLCLKTAVQHKLINVNPCSADTITLPSKKIARASGAEQLYLDMLEVRELADAVPPHYRLAALVASLCGLRAGELWALRRCDVDPLHGKLTVRYAVKEVAGRLVVGPTKTHQQRTMSVPQVVRIELAAALASPGVRLRKIRAHGSHGYPAIINGELGWTDDAQSPSRLLFTTPTGHPVRHTLFYQRVFRPSIKQLWPAPHRLHRLRWHDLRHTCASLSLAVSPNLHAVKERLGHDDIKTTVNRYGHLLPSVDEALADQLGAMFDSAAVRADGLVIRPGTS